MKKWIGRAALALLTYAPAQALAKKAAKTTDQGTDKPPDIEESMMLIVTAAFVIGCIVALVIFLRNKLSSDDLDQD